MTQNNDPNRMTIALAAQFFLTHLGAGLLGLYLSIIWFRTDIWFRLIGIASLAGLLGLILTLNVQITLRNIHKALSRLVNVLPVTKLPRLSGPLIDIVSLLMVLVERERPFAHLREQQLHQTSEAAIREERHRLARDLHDSIKQQLFSIHMSAAAMKARWQTDPNGVKEALTDVGHSTQAALVEMNALLQQLSPEPLAKMGLVQALQEQAEALGYRTGATVHVEIGPLPADDRFPLGAQENLFRLAQEALSNIARHARAQQVKLFLQQNKAQDQLTLQITDDGQGFDPNQVQGMGLTNMHRRVADLGGHLEIVTELQAGTSIHVLIPLSSYLSEQEYSMYQSDHTLNRAGLTMLGGGITLAAILFYPLYRWLPSRFLPDWPAASSSLSFILACLALVVLGGVGAIVAQIAAEPSRSSRFWWGGMAGGVAAALLFYGLGGAAAGVVGHRILLAHGLVMANSEFHFLWLLSESIVGTMWWGHLLFWFSLFIGVLCGGLGGLFVSTVKRKWSDLYLPLEAIGTAAMMGSLLSLVVSIAVLTLLGPQVATQASEIAVEGYFLSLPAFGVSVWPMLTPMLVYLLTLVASYRLLQYANRTNYQTHRIIVAYIYVLVTAALPLFIIPVVRPNPIASIVIGSGLVINLLFSLLFVRLAWRITQTLPPETIRDIFSRLFWRRTSQTTKTLPSAQTIIDRSDGRLLNLALYGIVSFIALLALINWLKLGFFTWLITVVIFIIFSLRWHLPGMIAAGNAAQALPRTIEGVVGAILALMFTFLVNVSPALSLILIAVNAIVVINPAFTDASLQEAPPLVHSVQSLYQAHAYSVGITFLMATIVVSIALVVLKLYTIRSTRKK